MGLTVGIAGGGIAGLTLAHALQARDIDVLVFERQPEVHDGGAGISLWPNALAALDVAGLGDLVRSLGRPLADGGQKTLDGRVAMRFTRRRFEAALGEGLVCVDRGELIRSIAGLLPAGTVRSGREVSGYSRDSAGVSVELTAGESLTVDALVGADGIGSAVARAMNGPLRMTYAGYTAWRGIAETTFAPDAAEIWACFAEDHEAGWMPVGDGRTYWFVTAWLPQGSRPPDGDGAYLREAFGHWPEPIPALVAATPPQRLVRNDVSDRARLRRWSDGPVTLVGDAAHPMRPHLGQGGCQAIEDAVALAGQLAQVGDPVGAFARYERRRRRRTDRIVALSRLSRFTRPPGPATTIFDGLAGVLHDVPIGPALWAIAPIAGYRAGLRAVDVR